MKLSVVTVTVYGIQKSNVSQWVRHAVELPKWEGGGMSRLGGMSKEVLPAFSRKQHCTEVRRVTAEPRDW